VTPSLICGAELALMSWEKISNKKKREMLYAAKSISRKIHE
jgi:hypothetical protein